MAKYRKKPVSVVIEAIQWLGFQKQIVIPEVRHYDPYVEKKGVCLHCLYPIYEHGWIQDTDGLREESNNVVCPNDWVITESNGRKHPCRPDIFEATYDKVE